MDLIVRVVVLASLVAGAASCSGGDDPDSGCAETCEAQTAGGCNLLPTEDCTEFCLALFGSVGGDCKNAMADKSVCMLAQPDICDIGMACDDEQEAMDQACN